MAAKLGKGGGHWSDEQPLSGNSTKWQLKTQHGGTLTFKISRPHGVRSKIKSMSLQLPEVEWC